MSTKREVQWSYIPLGLIGGVGDTLLDLVGCGLALLRRDLLLDLCERCQQCSIRQKGCVRRTVTQTLAAVVSHVDGVVVDCCVGSCVMCLEELVQMLSIAVLKKDVDEGEEGHKQRNREILKLTVRTTVPA